MAGTLDPWVATGTDSGSRSVCVDRHHQVRLGVLENQAAASGRA